MAALFQEEKPLEIRFSIPVESVKRSRVDSVYFPSILTYKNEAGTWDTIHIGVRARGKFRRKNCYLPPLRFKISKEDRKDKVFAGVKSLKLVLPCSQSKVGGDLILKEYICYQLYEPLTPYTFGTRMVDITLVDSGNGSRKYHMNGFFIEDDDAVAKRCQAKVVDLENLHPKFMHDTCTLRYDLFQYMIGNTDFSSAFFHNTKVIKTDAGRYIPIAYDFDMSGFVNAPYATFDESLNISNVRERIYRGYCRDDHVAQAVRAQYITLEPQIMAVIDRYQTVLDAREYKYVKYYMSEFFNTVKNDAIYKKQITEGCRDR
ncbi:MAG: hypothetical protein ABIS36_21510 [Chryseolinea sp.]